MIAVIQLVDKASVSITGQEESKKHIDLGLLVLLGVSKKDTEKDVSKLVNKVCKLRVFPDNEKKMNLDINSVHGEILLISQFTLLGNLQGGNRPDFIAAADKPLALKLYQKFSDLLLASNIPVKTGFFGEHMEISTNLCGPVTIILDSAQI
ncbi:MAG TPA: D-aminoacyl-tRNA deacylase [Candidatus Woesebacteria bacterium]|nr:D-aminoacyl-tRNA deacylase [Candidatus Woesebacteria bacterium]